MERNISIRKSNEICNCNSCSARNYESMGFPNLGDYFKKVDALYEVHIGSLCATLCLECLDELVKHIAVVRGAEL